MIVGISELPISTATTELIVSLTEPGWDESDGDPLETILGKAIADKVDGTKKRGKPRIADRMAAVVVRIARSSAIPSDESLDFNLRIMTGKDLMWWVDWIRDQRAK